MKSCSLVRNVTFVVTLLFQSGHVAKICVFGSGIISQRGQIRENGKFIKCLKLRNRKSRDIAKT